MPNTTIHRCPEFGPFASVGDSRTWQREGFVLTATIHADETTKPTDSDCFSDDQVEAWANGGWFYCGIVVTASKFDVKLAEASLWGIECNFDNTNSYLAEVANDMAEEAMDDAREVIKRFRE